MAWRPWGLPKTFDFSESVLRLQEASKYGFLHLEDIAQKEMSDMSAFRLPTHCVAPTRIDISHMYLQQCNMQDAGVPYYVNGNGSCLFNAVSLALCGNERLATELRARTCIEMVVRKDLYMSLPIAKSLIWVSPNYVASTIDCARVNGWSSIWTFFALAEVIGMPIESVYPPKNGTKDMSFKILNLFASPRNLKNNFDKVSVLWTRSAIHDQSKIWLPDHFAPLLKFMNISSVSPNVSMKSPKPQPVSPPFDNDNFPPLPKKPAASPLPTCAQTTVHSSPGRQIYPAEPTTIDPCLDTAALNSPIQFDDHTTESDDDIPQSDDSESLQLSDTTLTTYSDANQDMTPLPSGGFTAYAIYNMITTASADTVPQSIPLGKKSNCYTLANNIANKERKAASKHNRFCDDLGSWDSGKGTTVKSYYVLSQGFKCVYKKKDEYCIVQGKKRAFHPLIPQPEESDVVVMNRYYTTLKRQSDFKKRVTCFSSAAANDISNIVLVEYIGKLHHMQSTHGNAKTETAPYKRANPEPLKKQQKNY